MKHIFLINSHTQFLTSLGVISFLDLDQENILFIYSRNYQNNLLDLDIPIIDLSNVYTDCANLVANFSKQKEIINLVDTLILEKCNKALYKLYIPHLCYPFFQIFATHTLCVEIGLIQEASTIYPSRFINSTIRERLYSAFNFFFLPKKRIWKTFTWLIPNFILDHKNVEAYEIFDFFNLLPVKRNRVEWPSLRTEYVINVENPIYIFDSLVEQKYVEKELYFKFVEIMVEENIANCVYVKFHPSQTKENRSEIINIINRLCGEVKIIELPSDIPFEVFLLHYSNLWICGFNSSLVDFAAKLNHNVKDYRELLLKSKLYRKLLN